MSETAPSLLPPNATPLELALSRAAAMSHQPEHIATLWNPLRCPVAVLPWLAWAMSVDEWDDRWPEARQREAVQQAARLHRRKGTPWAIKRALQVHGYPDCEILEFKDYEKAWTEAGGLRMDGAWQMDGRFMAAHLDGASAVMRRSVFSHWAQYALRVNAADEFWSRSAQRDVAAIAKRYAPVRSHLVALIGWLRWGFYIPSGMALQRERVRIKFKGCTRLTSTRMRTMDGCWLMDAQQHAPVMAGAWRMDGARSMRTLSSGPQMQGGHLQVRQRMRLVVRLGACGVRQALQSMSAQPVLMDGRLRMDRNTMTGAFSLGRGHAMNAAQINRLGLAHMDGTQAMGQIHQSSVIAMRGTVTLRKGGQVMKELFL